MKIIFLDIDGVLNSRVDMLNGVHLNNHKVLLLRSLLDMDKDVKIVISSAWRILNDHEQIAMQLYRCGLGVRHSRVIGSTDNGYVEEGSVDNRHGLNQQRGLQIDRWLKNHPEVTEYVILDDSIDMTDYQLSNRFIRIDAETGLTECYCARAAVMLGLIEDSDDYWNCREYLTDINQIKNRNQLRREYYES
ncbi:hypothetical protein VPHD479_0280 [Vibrio phage D479]